MKTYRHLKVRIEFEPRDLWVGAYWKHKRLGMLRKLDIYICVLPVLPIHLTYVWGKLPPLRGKA